MYKVIFKGDVAPDRTVPEVKQSLASLMQAHVEQIDTLFSGQAIVIKKNLSYDHAARYVAAFQDIGALAEIRPQAETAGQGFESETEAEYGSGYGSEVEPAPEQAQTQAPQWDAPAAAAAEPVPPPPLSPQESTSLSVYTAAPQTYEQEEREWPLLSALGLLIKLILSLVFTGFAVAVLLGVVLWLVGGFEYLDIHTPGQLVERLSDLGRRLLAWLS